MGSLQKQEEGLHECLAGEEISAPPPAIFKVIFGGLPND